MINAGSTAWVLVSAALVMLMTPGLALFCGGPVRSKSVLMMMMNFVCLAVVGVLWVLFGYSLVFGDDIRSGLLGDLGHAGLRDAATLVGPESDRIPLLAFSMFQLMFAVITAALLAGAVADRAKFWSWVAFTVRGFPKDPMRPLLGAGLLWFGWFGFNAGSRQVVAAMVAMVYAFGVTFLLAWLIRATIGFRVTPEIEIAGIDEAEHAESAYELSLLGSSGRAGVGTVTSGLHTTGSAAREEF